MQERTGSIFHKHKILKGVEEAFHSKFDHVFFVGIFIEGVFSRQRNTSAGILNKVIK
jgi:hypothetical protein